MEIKEMEIKEMEILNENKVDKESRVFLVDSENISDYSFLDIYSVGPNDEVVIFSTENSKSIKVGFVEKLISSKANIVFENVTTGTPNELDFQLVAYLGMRVINSNSLFYIVSNDTGYISPINYIISKMPNLNIGIIKTNNVEDVLVSNKVLKANLSVINTDESDEVALTSEDKRDFLINEILESVNIIQNKKVHNKAKKIIADGLNSNADSLDIQKSLHKCIKGLNIGKSTALNITSTLMKPVNKFIDEAKLGNLDTSIKILIQ